MKTLKRVPIRHEFVEQLPRVKEMEEGVIYISEKYQTSGHRCLCGCGTEVIMPLGKNWWTASFDKKGRLTMSPSVGNQQFECRSHYIIVNGGANFVGA